MDPVKPLHILDGLSNQHHELLNPELVNNHVLNEVMKKKLMYDIEEPETSGGDDLTNDGPPARGLELIYKFAEELATRIEEEKRYEGIIRPCSVKVPRIPDTSQFKIIRDESMIIDESTKNDVTISNKEPSTDEEFNNLYEDMQIDHDLSDEEIILPPAENDTEKNDLPEEKALFACIFCQKKNLQGKSVASEHYHLHLDYYPYKCSQCLEVTTDLKNLFIHYRKDHSEAKTAAFKKKLMPWFSEWIDDFLKSQLKPQIGRGKNPTPRAYCPVCETNEKKEDIITLPPNLIQPRKHLMHVYKHLVYEPYVCLICQKAGKKYTASDYEDKVYEHILRHHPEAEDKLLDQVFEKSRCIKPLEKYIDHYLKSAGVSIKRRVPEKIPFFARNKFKAKQEIKEKEKIYFDINRTSTLGDLANQSSTSSINDQSDILTIGQKTDNLIKLSNQTKLNPNTTLTSHQMSKIPPTDHKPVSMMTPHHLLLSPSKGPSQLTTFAVNGVSFPNLVTVTSISISPKNQIINGVSSTTNQPLLLSTPQQPNVIQLPCGQLMVRNSTVTAISTQSSPQSSSPKQHGISLISSPPVILGQTSVVSPVRESISNEPVEIKTCPDVRSLVGYDISTKRKKEDNFVKRSYFCMFCKEMLNFESFTDGLFHFSTHLNYNPVNCLLCGEKFPDTDTIMKHFLEIHSHNKVCQDSEVCEPLLYYINREGHIEKWVEQYLYFQVSGELERLTSVDCSSFCIICKSITNNGRLLTRSTNKKGPTTKTPPVEIVRQHLNLHINYRPYECYLCSKAGTQIKFASVGETALKHLKNHGFSPVDKNFLKEFFHHKPIIELENFIKDYLITEYYPYLNGNGIQDNISSTQSTEKPAPFMFNGVKDHKNYLKPSGDNLPKRLFADEDQTNELFSSSHKRAHKNLSRTVLACYHCKLTINGGHELVTHCKTIHPNLSIASYCLPTSM